MTFEIIFVLLALLGMVMALILDKMRPGMVLFSVVVLFLCVGILTPKEMLEGFSNKGMITVAMLFWSVKVFASPVHWGNSSRNSSHKVKLLFSRRSSECCRQFPLSPLF